MDVPAYVISENSVFENLLMLDLNRADTCVLLYNNVVTLMKQLIDDAYGGTEMLTKTDVLYPDGTTRQKYHLQLSEPALLPLLGCLMSMDGKPYDEIQKHKEYRKNKQLDDDVLVVSKLYQDGHPIQHVELAQSVNIAKRKRSQ